MGRAFAERFAQEGMKVVLADVEEDALTAAVEELSQSEHDVIGGPKMRKAFIEGGRQVGAVDEEAGGVRIVVGSKCWPGG